MSMCVSCSIAFSRILHDFNRADTALVCIGTEAESWHLGSLIACTENVQHACSVHKTWAKAPQSLPSLLINPSLFVRNCVDQILQKQKGCIPLPLIIHTCSQPIYLITENVDPAEQLQHSVKDPSRIQGLQTQWKSLS